MRFIDFQLARCKITFRLIVSIQFHYINKNKLFEKQLRDKLRDSGLYRRDAVSQNVVLQKAESLYRFFSAYAETCEQSPHVKYYKTPN